MIQLLLKLVGCGDVEIQSAAAGCLSNIRNFIHNAWNETKIPFSLIDILEEYR
jgi:hypothetical protein